MAADVGPGSWQSRLLSGCRVLHKANGVDRLTAVVQRGGDALFVAGARVRVALRHHEELLDLAAATCVRARRRRLRGAEKLLLLLLGTEVDSSGDIR